MRSQRLLCCDGVGVTSSLRRLRSAVSAAGHSVSYARNLARGNRFASEMSWVQPGTPPVLLAHGFLGNRGTMVPLQKRLQRDGRICFSYHHGRWQTGSLRTSALELVDRLRHLDQELGVPQVDLVGFSMGGLVALHAVKFLGADRYVRRLSLLGAPVAGTWTSLAGVATIGLWSSSVWQILPGSSFLQELRDAPMPTHVDVQQVYAEQDVLCPQPMALDGVDRARDYHVLPGGHSSLVVAPPFHAKVLGFLDRAVAEDRDPTPAREPVARPDLDPAESTTSAA